MTKPAKIIAVCLAAAIVLTAAAIITVVVRKRGEPTDEPVQFNSAAAEENNSDTVQFGTYPQSRVTDEALIGKLNALDLEWKSYGYFNEGVTDDGVDDFMRYADAEYDGCQYRAVTMDFYRDSAPGGIDDDTDPEQLKIHGNYRCNTVYWFRYEPLKWRVLDAESGLLLCDQIIDTQQFNDSLWQVRGSHNNDYDEDDDYKYYNDYTDESCTSFGSDYAASSIRDWLNQTFLAVAFHPDEIERISTADLSNKGYHSLIGENGFEKLDGKDTKDKVFLLSYDDVLNPDYGFSSDADSADEAREAAFTDYSVIQGLFLTENQPYGEWMLRTPGYTSGHVCYVGRYPEDGGSFPGKYRKILHTDDGDPFSIVSAYAGVCGGTLSNGIGIRPSVICPSVVSGDIPSAETQTTVSATTQENNVTAKPTTTEAAATQAATTAPAAATTAPAATAKPASTTKPPKGSYTLTLYKDGGIAEVRGAGTYRAGDTVTVEATMLIGHTFRNWHSSSESLLPGSNLRTYTFKMPAGNVALKAVSYIKPTVSLIAGTGVQSVQGANTYAIGQLVTVTANMKDGYDFVGWSSDAPGFGSNQRSYTFAMPDKSITLTASGEARVYTVTVQAGTGISGVSGSGQYKVGDQVTVNATVQQNYTFSGWSGGVGGAVNNESYVFTMPARNLTLQAAAAANPKYTLTAEKEDPGITSVSGGGTFYPGASVSVSCQVAAGYIFAGWYSSNTDLLKDSTSQSYSFKMPNGNVTLTAKAKNNQYTVTVSMDSGIASVSGGGKYTVGSTVTISCQVKNGYKFSRWTSSNTSLVQDGTTHSYSFKMPDNDVTLTAKSINNKFTLTVSRGDNGVDSVSGGGTYIAGSSVTVNCVTKAGYDFKEWTSNYTSKLKGSTAQSYSFTMPEANVTLSAKTIKVQYTLTLHKGTGISSVSGAGTYTVGDAVTIDCVPSQGYAFTEWKSSSSGLLSGSKSQNFSFNMPKGNVTLTAYAKKNEYTVSITKGTGISSVGGNGKYTVGDTVTVYANVTSGYRFDRWIQNGNTKCYEITYTFTMPDKDVSLTAKAVKDTY